MGNKILFVANDSISGSEIWVIDAPVSVSNTAVAEEALNIYPNPSTGIFFIQSAMVFTKARITNITGQVVYNGAITNNTLKLENQPAGTYHVSLTAGDGTQYNRQVQVLK